VNLNNTTAPVNSIQSNLATSSTEQYSPSSSLMKQSIQKSALRRGFLKLNRVLLYSYDNFRIYFGKLFDKLFPVEFLNSSIPSIKSNSLSSV
jgi:hypothetical protein